MNETKNVHLDLRITKSEREKIKQLAKSHNLSVSAYVRMVLLSGGES